MLEILLSVLKDGQTLKEKRHILEQMYTERTRQEATWRKLSDYIFPMRGRFYEENGGKEGERRDQYLIDPYPMDAVTKCAAGLQSGLTSPSRPWFELSLQDTEKAENHRVRQWLNDAHDIMMGLYARSNAYTMLYNLEAEIAQFGTAAAIMLEDYEMGINYRAYTCGEYAGGVDARGNVTMFARRYSLNARQMVGEFGFDNCSMAVRNAYDRNDITQRFIVEMLIHKNLNFDYDNPSLLEKPWMSFYWEQGSHDQFLKVSGFYEQPFIMPRWTTVANEIYGTGPGHNALGNCMQLQKLEKNKLRATDNDADPAMIYPSVYKKINTNPGAKNFVQNSEFQAYPIVPPGSKRYEGMIALVNEKRQQIGASFYNDLLVMLTNQGNPNMTAREVAERHEEKLLMLGPVLEQFHNEVLEPMTLRTFGICLRNGLFPEMPEEIRADELKVNFVSLLAQAQQQVAMPAIEKVLAMTGNLIGVYPEAADMINIDKVIKKAVALNGAPEEILRDEDEIVTLRQQRAQAQQQQAMMQQAQVEAGAGKDVAQAARLMSETQTSGGNILDQILQQGGAIR